MNFKNLAMWAIIVFLTIGLYNMFKNPQANVRNGNQVIFSDFLIATLHLVELIIDLSLTFTFSNI